MRRGLDDAAAKGEKDIKQRQYDEAAAAELFKKLNADVAKEKASKKAAADELAKVPVDAAHVTLLAEHLDLSPSDAKTLLQRHGGKPDAAIKAHLKL